MMDFMGKRKWFYLLSLLVLVPGFISLMIPPALKAGIDFSSGSILTVGFTREEKVSQNDLSGELIALGHKDPSIQGDTENPNRFIIRTKSLDESTKDTDGNPIKPESQRIKEQLEAKFGATKPFDVDSISPVIATETVRNAIIAVLVAAVGMFFYIWWAFRKVPKPMRYGICAIIALAHDVMVVIGVFSLLGKFLDFEVNSMFLAAVLAVIGYSVNDTIIVFDRVRENMLRNVSPRFEMVMNVSLSETLSRSLNTTLTTCLAALAILVFGGVTIRPFVLALFIGFMSGAYSSIGIASPLLVDWENGNLGRLFRRMTFRKPKAQARAEPRAA